MTNTLAVREESAFELGKVFAESGMFPNVRKAAEAVVKIIAGREFGLGPMAAMNGIHMVDGKPTLAANLIAGQIKRHPNYDYRVVRRDETGCELRFLEGYQSGPWNEVGRMTFEKADADRAGLLGKQNWKKYPRDMYFARCLTAGARTFCPDVLGGSPIYTAEELGAEDTPRPDESWDDAARRDAIEVATGAPSRHAPTAEVADAEVVPDDKPKTIGDDVYDQLRTVCNEVKIDTDGLAWNLLSIGVETLPESPSKADCANAMRSLTLEQAFRLEALLKGEDDALPGMGA